MIGIIGALSVEIENLVEMMERCEEETVSRVKFYTGTISGADVVIAQSGVGKVHAAICAQTMILRYSPEMIINTGVAGALSGHLMKGDVVIATSLVQYDIDNSAFGYPVGMIPDAGIVHIPCSEPLIHSFRELAENTKGFACHAGTVATGDQFVCDGDKAGWIHRSFNALACEQEGGSIAQVCYVNDIDFCAIRAISDTADGDSQDDYFEFVRLATKRSADLIGRFIELRREQLLH